MMTLAALVALAGSIGTPHKAWADSDDKAALDKDIHDLKAETTKKLGDLDKKRDELATRVVDTKKATQADIDKLRQDADARRETIHADLARVDTATKETMSELKTSISKDLDSYKKTLDEWSSKTVKPHTTAAKPKPKPKK
jgi:hypothetical protein